MAVVQGGKVAYAISSPWMKQACPVMCSAAAYTTADPPIPELAGLGKRRSPRDCSEGGDGEVVKQ